MGGFVLCADPVLANLVKQRLKLICKSRAACLRSVGFVEGLRYGFCLSFILRASR